MSKPLSQEARRITQHLSVLGISDTECIRFATQVQIWLTKSGPEWTTDRLKSLRSALQQHLSKDTSSYDVPDGWAVRTNRKGKKIFRDPLIHFLFSTAKDNLVRSENALRIYQVFKLDKLSSKQYSKLKKAVETPQTLSQYTATLDLAKQIKVPSVHEIEVIFYELVDEESMNLSDFLGSTKVSPGISIKGGNPTVGKSIPRTNALSAHYVELLTRDRLTNRLWRLYQGDISKCIVGNRSSIPRVNTYEKLVDVPAGALKPLQEGGCKVRWIANPFLLYQALGEPLKQKLSAFTKRHFPQVLVHDQDQGREDVLKWMQNDVEVYSYDASAFTDRFPLALQVKVLRELKRNGVITSFDVASFLTIIRKSWVLQAKDEEYVKWSVGQPLGFGPSFALATLTHATVLKVLDTDKTDGWRIVGDDIVISDSTLARRYKETMTSIGVEINVSKSTISRTCTEFLGKLITLRGVSPSVKVKLITNRDQVVDLIKFYGSGFWYALDKRKQMLTLEAFAPLALGGLGFQPSTLSYSEWLERFDLDKHQESSLKQEISDFHDNPVRDPSISAWHFNLKEQFYRPIGQLIGVDNLTTSERRVVWQSEAVPSTFSHTVSVGTPIKAGHPFRQPTFVELVDKAFLLKQESADLPQSYMILDRNHGYARDNEMKSTLINRPRYITSIPKEEYSNGKSGKCKVRFKNRSKFRDEIEEDSATEESAKREQP